MTRHWEIRFTSGRVETVDGYRVKVEAGLLRIRTTHDDEFPDEWVSFPLANIEMWKEVRR